MLKAVALILLAGLPASLARAERQAQASAPAEARALSPYLIEWLIDLNEDADLREVWRRLKIDIPGDRPNRCGGDCGAETFDVAAGDERQGKAVALKLSLDGGNFRQYLIFRSAPSQSTGEVWKFIGNIDAPGRPDAAPGHRIITADDRTWLVVKELTGKGPSGAAYGEAWYEVREAAVRRVLSYPTSGRDDACQQGLRRSHKSLVLRHGPENGAYTVPVQYLISYEIGDCNKPDSLQPLISKARKAYYVWDGAKDEFSLDAARSEIAGEEIASLSAAAPLSDEKFLEHNFYELLDAAAGGSARQKSWLASFLARAPDSRFKAALETALQR